MTLATPHKLYLTAGHLYINWKNNGNEFKIECIKVQCLDIGLLIGRDSIHSISNL